MSTMHRELQAGFTLISALFLVVVLGALGVAMLRFSSVQHMDSALDVESARVFRFAQSGADYGAYQVLQNGGSCPASVNLSFPGGYAATVGCAAAGPFSEPGGNVNVYAISAIACNRPVSGGCPGSPNGLSYVERRLSVAISR